MLQPVIHFWQDSLTAAVLTTSLVLAYFQVPVRLMYRSLKTDASHEPEEGSRGSSGQDEA